MASNPQKRNSKSADDKSLEETKRLMARLAAMPHKPHIPQKTAKEKTKKKPVPKR